MPLDKDRQQSSLSLYSTAASENQTLAENSAAQQMQIEAKQEQLGDENVLKGDAMESTLR